MTPILRITLLYSLVPVLFTVVSAAAGAFVPGMARLPNSVLHLTAGVVFAVVSVELLPEITRRALVGDVVIGFALGIATMLVADKMIDRIRGDDDDDNGDNLAATDAREQVPAVSVSPATRVTVSASLFRNAALNAS